MPPKTTRTGATEIKCYQLKSAECRQHPDKCVYENYKCKNRAKSANATGAPPQPPAADVNPVTTGPIKCYTLKKTQCESHPDVCVYENNKCKKRKGPAAGKKTAPAPANAGESIKCYKLKKTQCESYPDVCVYENNKCKKKTKPASPITSTSTVTASPAIGSGHAITFNRLLGLFGPASGSPTPITTHGRNSSSPSSSGSSSTSSISSSGSSLPGTPSSKASTSGRKNKSATTSPSKTIVNGTPSAGSGVSASPTSSGGSTFSTQSLSPSDSLIQGLFSPAPPPGPAPVAPSHQVAIPVRDETSLNADAFNAYCTAIAMDRMGDKKAELQAYLDDDLGAREIAKLKSLRDYCLRFNGGQKRFAFKFQDAKRAIEKFEAAPDALSVPYAFDAVAVRKAMSAYWAKCTTGDLYTPGITEPANMYEAFKELADKGRFEELYVVAHMFTRPMRSMYTFTLGEMSASAGDNNWIPNRNSTRNPHSGPLYVEKMVQDVFCLPNLTLARERWPHSALPSWYTQAVARFLGSNLLPKLSPWKQASIIRAVLTMHKERPALHPDVQALQAANAWLDTWAFLDHIKENVLTAHRAGSLSWEGWVSSLWATALIFMYELEKNLIRRDRSKPLSAPEPVRNLQDILDFKPYEVDAVLAELKNAKNGSIRDAVTTLHEARPRTVS